jgi:hypothetical protein
MSKKAECRGRWSEIVGTDTAVAHKSRSDSFTNTDTSQTRSKTKAFPKKLVTRKMEDEGA